MILDSWIDAGADAGGIVHGRRLSDHMRQLHEKGDLSDRQWVATERFRDDWSLVAANGLGAMQHAPTQAGGGARNWLPGDALLSALRRLRLVFEYMDMRQRQVIILLVVESRPLSSVAKAIRCAKSKIAAILRTALEILAKNYVRNGNLFDH